MVVNKWQLLSIVLDQAVSWQIMKFQWAKDTRLSKIFNFVDLFSHVVSMSSTTYAKHCDCCPVIVFNPLESRGNYSDK